MSIFDHAVNRPSSLSSSSGTSRSSRTSRGHSHSVINPLHGHPHCSKARCRSSSLRALKQSFKAQSCASERCSPGALARAATSAATAALATGVPCITCGRHLAKPRRTSSRRMKIINSWTLIAPDMSWSIAFHKPLSSGLEISLVVIARHGSGRRIIRKNSSKPISPDPSTSTSLKTLYQQTFPIHFEAAAPILSTTAPCSMSEITGHVSSRSRYMPFVHSLYETRPELSASMRHHSA
mmetsp:Transcript_52270/g.125205  ORF Transcript_52270/g.125205 Transcript_52270/m.125205 type:complete len:238 (+) Transcript_52270:154-867(+)